MKLDIAAIRACAAAATPGPWRDDKGYRVLAPAIEDRCCEDLLVETKHNAFTNAGDSAFIAAARQDVPALCDEVERLEKDRASAVGELEAWKRAQVGVPVCFNCGAPCYFCLLYKTVLAERDDARAALADKALLLERYAVMRDQRDEARALTRDLINCDSSAPCWHEHVEAANEAVYRWAEKDGGT